MVERPTIDPIINLSKYPDHSLRRKVMGVIGNQAERLLAINRLRNLYRQLPVHDNVTDFLDDALNILGVDYEFEEQLFESIPRQGPAVVVSNHPFGGVDGIILAGLLTKVRPDVKMLANYLLNYIHDLRPMILSVDVFAGKEAAYKNLQALRQAIRYLKDGHMLMVFPAGEVSSFQVKSRRIEDPTWSTTIARLVKISKAPVVPVYFKGRNSALFHMAGMIHPLLRTVRLPRELLNKSTNKIQIKIGQAIPYKKLQEFETDEDLTAYLRFRTYLLKNSDRRQRARFLLPAKQQEKDMEPIIEPVPADVLAREVASLPAEQTLATASGLHVYEAYAPQIPNILREIGRLRETTFRMAGEGTGFSIDLDIYDEYYVHLFVWNPEKSEIVGAYRLGKADEIIKNHGKKGLYSSSLFRYPLALLKHIGPALELGRSFVRQEYQKSYSPLLMLWKGIGGLLIKYPQYRTLFGPVSISNDYKYFSRMLITSYMKTTNPWQDLSKMVRPRKPFKYKKIPGLNKGKTHLGPGDIEELSSWISGIEADGKGIPILLKQYIKLGGKILSFNIDPDFNDALDGLIMVDLMQTDIKVMKRYMGQAGYESYLGYHEQHRTLKIEGVPGDLSKMKLLKPIKRARQTTPEKQ